MTFSLSPALLDRSTNESGAANCLRIYASSETPLGRGGPCGAVNLALLDSTDTGCLILDTGCMVLDSGLSSIQRPVSSICNKYKMNRLHNIDNLLSMLQH